jgi:hypothetical protein
VDGVVADILDEQRYPLGYLLLDRERRLGGLMIGGVGRKKECREHAAGAPAVAEFMRPRKLQIGLNAKARDPGGAGRQTRTRRHRQIPWLRQRIELPFDGGNDIGKSAVGRPRESPDVIRQIDQQFEAGSDAQP